MRSVRFRWKIFFVAIAIEPTFDLSSSSSCSLHSRQSYRIVENSDVRKILFRPFVVSFVFHLFSFFTLFLSLSFFCYWPMRHLLVISISHAWQKKEIPRKGKKRVVGGEEGQKRKERKRKEILSNSLWQR